MNSTEPSAVSVAAIEQLTARRQALVEQIGKAVIGQQEIIDNTLLTLFAGDMRSSPASRAWPRPC